MAALSAAPFQNMVQESTASAQSLSVLWELMCCPCSLLPSFFTRSWHSSHRSSFELYGKLEEESISRQSPTAAWALSIHTVTLQFIPSAQVREASKAVTSLLSTV